MTVGTLSPSRRFSKWQTTWETLRGNILLVVVMALLLAMIMIPIARLLINSFLEGHPALPEGWTLQNYTTAFGMPLFYQALATTLWLAAVGTAITVVIAVLFAWLIERTDMPCRNLAWTLILIPMAIPGVLFALGWALLLSPKTGAMNVFLRDAFALFGFEMTEGPINIYSLGGLIFLDGLRGVTTVFLMVVGAFRMMDPSLEEAARVSKAGTIATFFRVTLPALTPAILAAAMYSFISSMESFEAPLAVGLPANIFVLSTLIYFTTRIQAPLDYGLAAVFGVSYMILMVFLLIWYRYAVRNSERFSTVSGKGFRPRIISIGKWRYPALALFVVYFLLAVLAPFCVLMWTSLLPGYRMPSADAIESDLVRQLFRDLRDRSGVGGHLEHPRADGGGRDGHHGAGLLGVLDHRARTGAWTRPARQSDVRAARDPGHRHRARADHGVSHTAAALHRPLRLDEHYRDRTGGCVHILRDPADEQRHHADP